jgi:hypothetical protein
MPENERGRLPFAGHGRMDERIALAREFWEVTRPDAVPFVSDEATWYDLDWLDDGALLSILEAHYGVTVGRDKLQMPFWALLDFLSLSRSR